MMREVRSAANAKATKASRVTSWVSGIPTPSNPAFSASAMKSATSFTGAQAGTRKIMSRAIVFSSHCSFSLLTEKAMMGVKVRVQSSALPLLVAGAGTLISFHGLTKMRRVGSRKSIKTAPAKLHTADSVIAMV